MAQDYTKRMILPLEGFNDINFRTKNYFNPIAHGYTRVVIGDRGPYIEFNNLQINLQELRVPPNQNWRFFGGNAYYLEYRTNNDDNVKVYYQLKLVDYADYKVGMYYISPFDLVSDKYQKLITELTRRKNGKPTK